MCLKTTPHYVYVIKIVTDKTLIKKRYPKSACEHLPLLSRYFTSFAVYDLPRDSSRQLVVPLGTLELERRDCEKCAVALRRFLKVKVRTPFSFSELRAYRKRSNDMYYNTVTLLLPKW